MAGLAAGCTKVNPDICCVTDAQCAAFDLTDHIPCGPGLACSPTKAVCVAAECQLAVDCPASAPLCVDHLCAATCEVDGDCAGIADKPFCLAATGQCVGCLDASTCPADRAFCDADSHACRGCELDAQCASGVCVEADGVCADPAALLYVSSIGSDTGDCTTAPCASIAYALTKVTNTRSIIRLQGRRLTDDNRSIHFRGPVIIDGDNTVLSTPTSTPTFIFDTLFAGQVTFEGLTLDTSGTARVAGTISTQNAMRLFDVIMMNTSLEVNGSLDARRITAMTSSFTCTSGTVALRESTFDDSEIGSTNCAVSLMQNRFSSDGTAAMLTGGGVTVENNIFVTASEFTDALVMFSNTPSSIVAFNTFVNTTSVVQSPVAVTCDSTALVTSNIFAYNSTHPVSDGCTARASLYDLVGAPSAGSNATADPASFFVDRATGDFRLAPNSPAIGIGELGFVTVDFTGAARPAPAGSRPDAGAYEAR